MKWPSGFASVETFDMFLGFVRCQRMVTIKNLISWQLTTLDQKKTILPHYFISIYSAMTSQIVDQLCDRDKQHKMIRFGLVVLCRYFSVNLTRPRSRALFIQPTKPYKESWQKRLLNRKKRQLIKLRFNIYKQIEKHIHEWGVHLSRVFSDELVSVARAVEDTLFITAPSLAMYKDSRLLRSRTEILVRHAALKVLMFPDISIITERWFEKGVENTTTEEVATTYCSGWNVIWFYKSLLTWPIS